MIAPVAPGLPVALDLGGRIEAFAVVGATREMAASLVATPEGDALQVEGKAPPGLWSDYLSAFPEITVVAVPAPGGAWVGVPRGDAGGLAAEPRRIRLAPSDLHAFDAVIGRFDNMNLLFDRHDPIADARSAAALRDLRRNGRPLAEAEAATHDPALRAAYRLAGDAPLLRRVADEGALRPFRGLPVGRR